MRLIMSKFVIMFRVIKSGAMYVWADLILIIFDIILKESEAQFLCSLVARVVIYADIFNAILYHNILAPYWLFFI